MSPNNNSTTTILTGVMEIIAGAGKLNGLAPEQDFYDAGVTSVMALPILLDLEDRFQVTIPDDLFITARSPKAVADIIVRLRQE